MSLLIGWEEKCWKGYEKKGMKTMFGKRYPNCVKKKKSESVNKKKFKDLERDKIRFQTNFKWKIIASIKLTQNQVREEKRDKFLL